MVVPVVLVLVVTLPSLLVTQLMLTPVEGRFSSRVALVSLEVGL